MSPTFFCHSLQRFWGMIDLQCCNYCHLPSDNVSSRFQSSMTIFQHKLLIREGRVLSNGWTYPSLLDTCKLISYEVSSEKSPYDTKYVHIGGLNGGLWERNAKIRSEIWNKNIRFLQFSGWHYRGWYYGVWGVLVPGHLPRINVNLLPWTLSAHCCERERL